LSETRPRRDVSTSRDGLETETSRPRPHPWSAEVELRLCQKLCFRTRYSSQKPDSWQSYKSYIIIRFENMNVILKIDLEFKTFAVVVKTVNDFHEVNFHAIKLASEMQTKELVILIKYIE